MTIYQYDNDVKASVAIRSNVSNKKNWVSFLLYFLRIYQKQIRSFGQARLQIFLKGRRLYQAVRWHVRFTGLSPKGQESVSHRILTFKVVLLQCKRPQGG